LGLFDIERGRQLIFKGEKERGKYVSLALGRAFAQELCVKLSIEPLVRSKKNDGVKNFNATIFLTGSTQGGKQRGGGTNDF
jgi:hypothetical protein